MINQPLKMQMRVLQEDENGFPDAAVFAYSAQDMKEWMQESIVHTGRKATQAEFSQMAEAYIQAATDCVLNIMQQMYGQYCGKTYVAVDIHQEGNSIYTTTMNAECLDDYAGGAADFDEDYDDEDDGYEDDDDYGDYEEEEDLDEEDMGEIHQAEQYMAEGKAQMDQALNELKETAQASGTKKAASGKKKQKKQNKFVFRTGYLFPDMSAAIDAAGTSITVPGRSWLCKAKEGYAIVIERTFKDVGNGKKKEDGDWRSFMLGSIEYGGIPIRSELAVGLSVK